MKPEDGPNDLLCDDPHPVPTLDMEQFMAEDRVLNVGRLSRKSVGQEHQWTTYSERDGLLEVRHVPNVGAHGEPLTKFRVLGGQRRKAATASEPTKMQCAIPHPGQPHQHSDRENGHK